ncbi:MAG: hypothetical protein Q8P28_08970 [Deltaproteobacteria bacterium]|nr:hypothetical protein [Deltaproteobacteria bacterium]
MKKILMIIAIAITVTACAAISSIKVQTEGIKITKEQAEGIKPGSTARNIIIETFGNPIKMESKTDGTDVLTYTYTEKQTPTYLGEFIVNERQSKITKITLEVIIKDGLVLSYKFGQEEKK